MQGYVISLSSHDDGALVELAGAIGRYLARTTKPSSSAAFAGQLTMAGLARTLLEGRDAGPVRLAFVAHGVSEVVDKLAFIEREREDGRALRRRGVYMSNALHSVIEGEGHGDCDRRYVEQLAAGGHYDRLAQLWVLGFVMDWTSVFPQLEAARMVYLPAAPLARRRHWPGAAGAAPEAPQAPQSPPPASTPVPSLEVEVEAPAPTPEWAGLPQALQEQHVRNYLQRKIAAVLEYPAGELPRVDAGFFDLGMTSVHLVTVRVQLTKDFAVEPSDTSAFDYPTIAEFARYVVRELAPHGPDEAREEPTAVVPAAIEGLHEFDIDAIERLSPAELERVLERVA